MGENATEGIFIAVYVFVFIIALSATITMFYMINNYAELSYEYGKNVENSGTLIENTSKSTYRLVTGSEVISYFFNYKKNNTGDDYKYNIQILDEKGIDEFAITGFDESYAWVLKSITPSDIYYLTYDSINEINDKITINITIKKADDNVLQQING